MCTIVIELKKKKKNLFFYHFYYSVDKLVQVEII